MTNIGFDDAISWGWVVIPDKCPGEKAVQFGCSPSLADKADHRSRHYSWGYHRNDFCGLIAVNAHVSELADDKRPTGIIERHETAICQWQWSVPAPDRVQRAIVTSRAGAADGGPSGARLPQIGSVASREFHDPPGPGGEAQSGVGADSGVVGSLNLL